MNNKSLILCYLDSHWIPFQDVETCQSYLLRLKNDFDFDISKVRAFKTQFEEITINI